MKIENFINLWLNPKIDRVLPTLIRFKQNFTKLNLKPNRLLE